MAFCKGTCTVCSHARRVTRMPASDRNRTPSSPSGSILPSRLSFTFHPARPLLPGKVLANLPRGFYWASLLPWAAHGHLRLSTCPPSLCWCETQGERRALCSTPHAHTRTDPFLTHWRCWRRLGDRPSVLLGPQTTAQSSSRFSPARRSFCRRQQGRLLAG